jgi:flagellar protein FlgJ
MLSTIPSAIDPSTLSRLREASRSNPDDALNAAASQFEALFLQMMLKSMRAGTPGGGIMDSKQVEFYREMFDQQLAVALSKAGTVGIADVVAGQLGGVAALDPKDPKHSVQTLERRPFPTPVLRLAIPTETPHDASQRSIPASSSVDNGTTTPAIQGPESFVDSLWDIARDTARLLGVPPQVLLAQAALESAWGRSMPKLEDGASSNNLFGIKAHPGWTGRRAHASTLEFTEAGAERIRAPFRAYDSLQESFQDYGRLISQDPRYAQALHSDGDPEHYLNALQQGGYATDPNYAAKIRAIIDSDTLRVAIEKLKV